VSGRTFGATENVQSGSVALKDGINPQFTSWTGRPVNYAVFTFNVPAGADRLNASIAYPGTAFQDIPVYLILIDPQGRFAANTAPQGAASFGNVDVREPAQGTWTGVIFGAVAARGGVNGTIPWQVSTQSFVPFGTVAPPSLFLAPGQSRKINVIASTPSTPGDLAGSIVLTPSGGGVDSTLGAERNSIAVTLRSLVDVAHGGALSGVLTGGNGRAPGEGQVGYYQFNIGRGNTSITANLSLTNDVGDMVGSYLVAPDGGGPRLRAEQPGRNQRPVADRLHPQPCCRHLDPGRGFRRAGCRGRDLPAVQRQHQAEQCRSLGVRLAEQHEYDIACGRAADRTGDDHQQRRGTGAVLHRRPARYDDELPVGVIHPAANQ
jgi:hypothetical protein